MPEDALQESFHPAIPWLVRQLGAFDEVDKVILFGSRARGDAGSTSDIDIAVSCPGITSRQWSDIWVLADAAPTLLKVDLVWLEEVGEKLRRSILEEGIVLYERKKLS